MATLAPTRELRLLDLSVLLKEEEGVTEFESLDMTVHMLFLAGKHSYKLTRAIAEAARIARFDGLLYPSYFSLLRLGEMPFQTVYGVSQRRIPQLQDPCRRGTDTLHGPMKKVCSYEVANGNTPLELQSRVMTSLERAGIRTLRAGFCWQQHFLSSYRQIRAIRL